mmetsp:Transcript_32011/g.38201  ORF Transcript_32011/g.38201 Transcript_32011/m.38201 type:complete len:83 (-) Transcript_32011:144-392(-)
MPGQAISLLHTKYAGGKTIRVNDIVSIFKSCRPNIPKDSTIVRTLLADLRHCHNFLFNSDLSDSAMRIMRRSLVDNDAVPCQ